MSKKTRLEAFRSQDENHPLLSLPDIETEHAAGYLIGLLHEAGLMSSNGMGPVPISWQEIDSWMSVTEAEISVWERMMIKTLSDEYVSELVQATAPNRPAPYNQIQVDEDINRETVVNKFEGWLSRLKGRAPVEETQEEEA